MKNVAVTFSVPQSIHEWPLKRAFFDKFFPVKISIQCCKINHIMNYIIVIIITTDKISKHFYTFRQFAMWYAVLSILFHPKVNLVNYFEVSDLSTNKARIQSNNAIIEKKVNFLKNGLQIHSLQIKNLLSTSSICLKIQSRKLKIDAVRIPHKCIDVW